MTWILSEIHVGLVNDDGEQVGNAEIIESVDLFSAPLGLTVQIEVDSPEEELQVFQIPVNNGESHEDRDEAYSGDWYRTWGDFLSGSSDDPMSYNQWILVQGDQDEDETPVDDRARLFYTVRMGGRG